MSRVWMTCALWVAWMVLAPGGLAQAPAVSGSDSFTAVATAVVGGGGRGASESYDAEVGVGQSTGGWQAASESFELIGGVVGTSVPDPSMTDTLVLGAEPGRGDKAGGETVRVLLYGGAPGGQIAVHGAPVPAQGPVQPTFVDVTTPPGVNVFGNPLGSGPIAWLSGSGFSVAPRGFTYLPALVEDAPALRGATWRVRVVGESPQFLWTLVLGVAVPGLALPLKTLEGRLEVLTSPIFTPILFSPATEVPLALDIPDDPALAGVALDAQAIVMSSVNPLVGSFTNRLPLVIP